MSKFTAPPRQFTENATEPPQIYKIAEFYPISAFLKSIARALGAKGHEVRIVGGGLRDFIMGIECADYDMATTAHPDIMMEALADFRVIPTGLSHGTLTVVDQASGQKAEITALRRDVTTDGRHATVEFGVDWRVDAERRDFTFNALSLDFSGRLYDYVKGYDDIKQRRLRFVGVPSQRIKEDALRILRFYRFMATRATDYDHQSHASCIEHRQLLEKLPAERIWQECKCILREPMGLETWLRMEEDGILAVLIPELNPACSRLRALYKLESFLGYSGTAARLAMIGVDNTVLRRCFKLSNSMTRAVADALQAKWQDFSTERLRSHLWSHDKETLMDWLRCLIAKKDEAGGKPKDLEALKEQILTMVPHPFPVTGKDFLARGIHQGLPLGRMMADLRSWWLAQNPIPNRGATIKQLEAMILTQKNDAG